MPDTLNCKAVYMTESKLLLKTQLREERIVLDKRLYCVLTRGCKEAGTPSSCHRKEIGEPTEVIVTYRKELSPRSKSDSRIFTYFHRKRQVIFALDTI